MIDTLADVALRPNRFQFAIVLTVAASGGLVSLSFGASLAAVLVATLAGALVGIVLTAYLTHIAPDSGASNRPGRGRGPR
ncbi:hypothetical protein GCM10028857_04630 [Salinarchaeum chitinilyticum]